MKYSLPLLISLAWVSILVLSGCSNDNLAQRPCAETTTCSQPVTNTCAGKNIASDKWTSLGLENESITAIAVHPCNPGIIYAGTQYNFSAGTQGKLFKTTDCGQSWDTLAVGGSYRTIQLQPGNPDVVYAVNGGILKSTNGGQTWQQANEGIDLDAETGVGSLAINPKNACILYAGTSGFYGGNLYKSTNAGKNWQRVQPLGLKKNRLRSGVTSLAINPNNPDEVYAGTALSGDVLHSFNGGITWLPTGLVDTGSIVDDLLVISRNDKVIAGIRFSGFFYTINRGNSWEILSENFDGSEFSTNKLVVSPTDNLKMYATIKRLAYQSKDGGQNWFKQVEIDSLNNVQVKTISSEGKFLLGSSPDQGITIMRTN